MQFKFSLRYGLKQLGDRFSKVFKCAVKNWSSVCAIRLQFYVAIHSHFKKHQLTNDVYEH